MTRERLLHILRLCMIPSGMKRAAYLKKKNVFRGIGDNVLWMDRKVPLYPKLIHIHDNVRIASHVSFITHDVTHAMLNNRCGEPRYLENIGCIEIMDNVFIGSNSTLLSNIRIGPNSIVAAGSVVTKDVPPNSVVGGVPARVLCSLDDYLARRINKYPEELKPRHQDTPEALVEFMWKDFVQQRQ